MKPFDMRCRFGQLAVGLSRPCDARCLKHALSCRMASLMADPSSEKGPHALMGQAMRKMDTQRWGAPVRLALGLILCLGLGACSSTFRNHGYVPTEAELGEIQVGRDTRDSVADKIGRPAAGGVVRDDVWYYVQSRVETYAYRAPHVIERQVLAVSFSNAGTVRNIERFGLEDGRVITLNRRVTDSNIQGVSFIRQLMGNVGRVDAGTLLNE